MENWKRTICEIYKMYATIDISRLGTSNDEIFIPYRYRERTVENFLNSFKPVFGILSRLQGTAIRRRDFDRLWEDCKDYLTKVGFDKNPTFMAEGSDFHRAAMNFWSREYGNELEGLSAMFSMFKACFGIHGNDDYCRLNYGGVDSFSWDKMRKCLASESREVEEVKVPLRNHEDYEWKESTLQKLQEARKKLCQQIETSDTKQGQSGLASTEKRKPLQTTDEKPSTERQKENN